MTLLLGVETGGTKIVARIVDTDGVVVAQGRWPTTTPAAAADAIVEFAGAAARDGGQIVAAGLAAFGPILIDPDLADRGRMLDSPKPGWAGSNLRAELAERLTVPVGIETDVNAAALAELHRGAGRGLPSVAYLTVGTGIGAGLATQAGTLSGAMHPEVGHIRLVRAASDRISSSCPFHDDCAEGLAAGPAVTSRLSGDRLDDRSDVRAIVADYLGQLCAMIVLAWSPHRIVIGGGVGSAPAMLDAVRAAYARSLGRYGVGPRARSDDFLVAASLTHAGLDGALLLARSMIEDFSA